MRYEAGLQLPEAAEGAFAQIYGTVFLYNSPTARGLGDVRRYTAGDEVDEAARE